MKKLDPDFIVTDDLVFRLSQVVCINERLNHGSPREMMTHVTIHAKGAGFQTLTGSIRMSALLLMMENQAAQPHSGIVPSESVALPYEEKPMGCSWRQLPYPDGPAKRCGRKAEPDSEYCARHRSIP